MRRNRKGIALFLALSLMAGICSLQGCSSSAGQSQGSNVSTVGTDGEEPYTIVYAFDVWMQQPDWDLVEENLNTLVEEKIGARVELLPMTGANYDQQINLMISSGGEAGPVQRFGKDDIHDRCLLQQNHGSR